MTLDREWRIFEAREGIPVEIAKEGTYVRRRADGKTKVVHTVKVSRRGKSQVMYLDLD